MDPTKVVRRVACIAWLLAISPAGWSQDRAQDMRTEVAHRRSVSLLEADPTLARDPSTLLVRFHANQTDVDRQALRNLVGAARLRGFASVPGLELISINMHVDQAIDALTPHVMYAEPNWVHRAIGSSNDTYIDLQWGIHNTGQTIQGSVGTPDADIDGFEAWDITTGNANFVVAIIDTGTEWSHVDLAANIYSNPGEVAGNGVDDDGNGYVDDVRGWDFYSNDNDPGDSDGHGTHTAGTVGAVGNNGIGVAGVNWQCKLMPLRFLGPQGGYTSDAILAVEYCAAMGVRVSNNSWGGGGFSTGLYDAIDASKAMGHVFVAASGNSGVNTDSSPHYPSSYNLDNIVSVAATDNQDQMASFSNYGASSVDLGAPGVDIASTYTGDGYVWMSGTSMACPHVAGVATLVYAKNPGWSYSQVVSQLLSTVRPTSAMSGTTVTGGVLNAQAAVNTGGGDTTPPANPTGLAASAGDSTVGLAWNANSESDLAGYRVYRSTTSGSGYTEISSGLIAVTTYDDGGLTNGTTYYYTVRAEDTSGNLSGGSNEAEATPTGGGGTQVLFSDGFESGSFGGGGWATDNGKASVTGGASYSGSSGARLKRTTGMQVGVDTTGHTDIVLSYACRTRNLDSREALSVYWTSNGGAVWSLVDTFTSTGWTQRSINLGAAASNNSTFMIRFSTNANRNNEYADIDDVEIIGTGNGGGDTTPPAPPTGLGATAGNASVALAWNANTEPDLAGYRVYRSTSSGGGYSDVGGGLVSGTSFNDTGLTNGTTYYYVVRAQDTSGNVSGDSNEANATPAGSGIDLNATWFKKKGRVIVDLSWSGSSSAMDIYRSGSLIATGVSGPSYRDETGLKGGGVLVYQICESGGGACSNEVTVDY
jgi:subtilisin family serine protease